MKKLLLGFGAAALLAACSSQQDGAFTLTIPMPDLDGATAYLVNYDTGEKTDSAVVTSDTLKFVGIAETPYLARVIVDGSRAGILVVEKGNITFDKDGNAVGTELNERLNTLGAKMDSIEREARNVPQDSAGMVKLNQLNEAYNALLAETLKKNPDNPVGYFAFLQQAYEMSLDELESALKEYPAMADYTRVKNLKEALICKAETSEGSMYKDFEVPGDSVAQKLSTYIGIDGKLTIVDFWASWCGPCRQEIPVIKALYAKYKDDLNVVGVAVWDEPENTLRAIDELGITWPCIIDAQTIPTDIYGISGIPCILVIGADGKILSRDKQGAELTAAVDSLVALRHPAAVNPE